MVFAADAGLLADGVVVASAFHYEERRPEEERWREIFRGFGLELLSLGPGVCFEGGDAVRFGESVFLGHGFRTVARAGPLLGELLQAEVVPLALADPWFFHLDMCCAALNDQTMVLAEGVLSPKAETELRLRVPHIIDVPRDAACAFACNAVVFAPTSLLPVGPSASVARSREPGSSCAPSM
jgi:N-dimethylarginine dimethylaminohydrolase